MAGHNDEVAGEAAPWWRTFFEGPWGKMQRAGFPPSARTQREVGLITAGLGLARPARILDVPCGAGRHTVALAVLGHDVCGVDLNQDAIDVARRDANAAGVSVDFQVGDMRSFRIDRPFDAAFSYFGSFGYFDDEGNLQTARAVAQSLRPGGSFFLDTPVVETLLPAFKERDWTAVGEGDAQQLVLEERHWDHQAGRILSTWTFVGPDGRSSQEMSMRIYTCREVRALLREAGFTGFRETETTSGNTFRMGATRLGIIATK